MPKHATDTSFKKGPDPRRNLKGRPLGAIDASKKNVQEMCQFITGKQEFWEIIWAKHLKGELSPGEVIEIMHYAGGKPPSTVIRKEVPRSVAEERHARALAALPEEKRYALADILIEVERLQRSLPPAKVIEVKAKRKKAGK